MFHHKHDHERNMSELRSIHDTGNSAMGFADKIIKTGKRGKILWISALGLWGLLILMTVLIMLHNQELGPIPVGLAVMCIIGAFPLLLLSVATFLYPYEFWRFSHSFNLHVRGGEPTDFAIALHYVSGVFGVLMTFGIVVALLAWVR